MTHFIDGLKVQMRMFLDTSVGVTLRAETNEELKAWIENMCQNEYHSSEWSVKQKVFMQLIFKKNKVPYH